MLMMDQLTHRGLAALAAKYGGLFHLRLGHVHTVVVSTPEYAREVLQVQDIAFSNRPASTAIAYLTYDRADMAFAHYGHFWRQVRKLSAVKLFSRRRTESWLAVREGSAALVRTVAEGAGQAVNVGELISALTNNVVLRAAFGTRDGGRQDEFIALMQEFSSLFGAFNVGDFIPWLSWVDARSINKRLRDARAFLDDLIDHIIDEHVKSGKSADDADADMVDDMLAYLDEAAVGDTARNGKKDVDELHNGFRLTRNNIKAIIMVRVRWRNFVQ
jgi:ferulate-5-hydroxylase